MREGGLRGPRPTIVTAFVLVRRKGRRVCREGAKEVKLGVSY